MPLVGVPKAMLLNYICCTRMKKMSLTHEVSALLRKELLLEWKQKFAIYGLLMYALSMDFVDSLGHQSSLPAKAWSVVYWVI